jgi:hypothetical protein
MSQIRVGNATHTGRMLGYCAECGLHHGGTQAATSCSALLGAIGTEEEQSKWRALKRAVSREDFL